MLPYGAIEEASIGVDVPRRVLPPASEATVSGGGPAHFPSEFGSEPTLSTFGKGATNALNSQS
jgi:hypothetical protein